MVADRVGDSHLEAVRCLPVGVAEESLLDQSVRAIVPGGGGG